MFPPLWSSILLVPLEGLTNTMLDFERCSKNAPQPIPPVFVKLVQHS
jgi:hypothetical protein